MDSIDIRDPQFYASWSEDELRDHIKKLNEILGLKQGIRPLPKKDTIQRMFDPKNPNFLGTGMTIQEFLTASYVRDIQDNVVFQEVEERRRRMDLIVELAAELAKIKEQTRFGTRLAEAVIEDVIKGDWSGVRVLGESFKFEDEHESLRMREGPIYAKFVALCQKAFDTRPGAEELATAPKN